MLEEVLQSTRKYLLPVLLMAGCIKPYAPKPMNEPSPFQSVQPYVQKPVPSEKELKPIPAALPTCPDNVDENIASIARQVKERADEHSGDLYTKVVLAGGKFVVTYQDRGVEGPDAADILSIHVNEKTFIDHKLDGYQCLSEGDADPEPRSADSLYPGAVYRNIVQQVIMGLKRERRK